MNTSSKTEQENFWKGKFGDSYIDRNNKTNLIESNKYLFSKIFQEINYSKSILEIGSNIGLNLLAIKSLFPDIELSAIEINNKAAIELKQNIPDVKLYQQSILEYEVDYKRDIVLSKGVLIHINPAKLNQVYEILFNVSKKYIIIAEYYNPTPIMLNYRGHKDRLYKRDFAGELLDKYKSSLSLKDYGFSYHGDNKYPQDDLTWFLLEKITS